MKQHPIPQDITNYSFHLIGNMTLKQFGELAAATIVALIIYSTNLPGILKWPLIALTVILGIMIAFVPIEERPLDHWIITFFKNIYQPTKFYWKKEKHIPDPFNYKPGAQVLSYFQPDVDLSPARKKRISDYLQSIPGEEKVDAFDLAENQRVSQVLASYDQVEVKDENIEIEPTSKKPVLKTRVRSLKKTQNNQDEDLTTTQVENETSTVFEKDEATNLNFPNNSREAAENNDWSIAENETKNYSNPNGQAHNNNHLAENTQLIYQQVTSSEENPRQLEEDSEQPVEISLPKTEDVNVLPESKEILLPNESSVMPTISNEQPTISNTRPSIPDAPPQASTPQLVTIEQTEKIATQSTEQPSNSIQAEEIQEELNQEQDTELIPESQSLVDTKNEENVAAEAPIEEEVEEEKPALKTQFNQQLPIPMRATSPNKLCGMVLNQAGELISNALIEVIDEDNRSCRIVKSNPLGQFFISTPLGNGHYTLKTEAENYDFDTFPMEFKGKVLPPIEIRANS